METTKTESKIESQNRQIINEDIETMNTNLLTKPKTRWFHWWILPNIKKIINSNHSQTLPKKLRSESQAPSEDSVTLTPKPDKEHYKNINLQADRSDEYKYRSLNKFSSKLTRSYTMIKWNLFLPQKNGTLYYI